MSSLSCVLWPTDFLGDKKLASNLLGRGGGEEEEEEEEEDDDDDDDDDNDDECVDEKELEEVEEEG